MQSMIDLGDLVNQFMMKNGVPRLDMSLDDDGTDKLFPEQYTGILMNDILRHILDNSADAILGQGYVHFVTKSAGQSNVIEIEDGGIGYKGDRSRLVECGFSTKGERRGKGLFLAHNYTMSLGGHIEFESLPPDGFINRIILPKEIQIDQERLDYIQALY